MLLIFTSEPRAGEVVDSDGEQLTIGRFAKSDLQLPHATAFLRGHTFRPVTGYPLPPPQGMPGQEPGAPKRPSGMVWPGGARR